MAFGLDDNEAQCLISGSDTENFDKLYKLHWKGLCIFAFKITGSMSIAKDIVQEVFVSFLERDEGQITNISAYLKQSVRFKCLNWMRNDNIHREHLSRMEAIVHSCNTESSINLAHINETVRTALSAMSPRCREIYILSRYKFFSNKEIADKLNIDVRTVDNQLSSALRVIRSRMKN